MSQQYKVYINGKAVDAPSTFGVINPATEEVFAQAPDCSTAQLEEAISAAQTAFLSWSRLPHSERQQYVSKIADAIDARRDEIARVLVQEQGKSLASATGEIMGAALVARNNAAAELPVVVHEDAPTHRVEIRRKPLGVVGGITPWNFPALICIQKITPAIVCGNTVIVKPSPFTPLSSLIIGEIVNQILPPGVATVLSGGNDLGAALVNHPGVAKITFTGSVLTGQRIQEACAKQVKRVTLELGGNDAAIVLGDVDIAATAPKIWGAAFANTGQVCCAIKRVFVPESKYEEWVGALAAECSKHTFGNGLEAGTEYGPLNNKMQFDRVTELVNDARKAGARIVCGGNPTEGGKGYFYPPTIVADVNDQVRIVAEEQFGPALPVLKYTSEDEAVARANASQFGLGASVWGADVEKAVDIAGRMDAGTCWVNEHLAVNGFATPFGGRKYSGIGREGGAWGLDAYTEPVTISINKAV